MQNRKTVYSKSIRLGSTLMLASKSISFWPPDWKIWQKAQLILWRKFILMIIQCYKVWKLWKSFDRIFVKAIFTKEVTNSHFGNYGNLLSHFLGKNFVKPTHWLNKLLKSWFDGKKFRWEKFFIFPQCAVLKKNEKLSLTKNISSNQLFSNIA